MGEGGGEYQDFPSKRFCLIVPRNFIGEPFFDVFQKNSGSGKAQGKLGGGEVTRFSVEKTLSHSDEKLHRGTLL